MEANYALESVAAAASVLVAWWYLGWDHWWVRVWRWFVSLLLLIALAAAVAPGHLRIVFLGLAVIVLIVRRAFKRRLRQPPLPRTAEAERLGGYLALVTDGYAAGSFIQGTRRSELLERAERDGLRAVATVVVVWEREIEDGTTREVPMVLLQRRDGTAFETKFPSRLSARHLRTLIRAEWGAQLELAQAGIVKGLDAAEPQWRRMLPALAAVASPPLASLRGGPRLRRRLQLSRQP